MIRIIQDNINDRKDIFSAVAEKPNVTETVREIIERVKKEGDAALRFYTEKFDRAKLNALRVTAEEIDEGVALVEPEFLAILQKRHKIISTRPPSRSRRPHRTDRCGRT